MFKCKNCGYTSITWFGRCPKCQSYEVEEVLEVVSSKKDKKIANRLSAENFNITNIKKALKQQSNFAKFSTGFSEVDNVLNKLVLGGVYLLGGEPGVGKSTLALQILGNLAIQNIPVIYVTAEESLWQLAHRAKRVLPENVLDNINIIASNDLDAVLLKLSKTTNAVVVFDSMQAMQIYDANASVGGVSQAKEIVYKIVNFSKTNNVTSIIIGQVTKQGIIAGPKLAEHIVDVVAYLEHVDIGDIRLIRVIKNRFGDVGNIGFLQITQKGFSDAPLAYKKWVDEKLARYPGVSFGVVMYGIRPLAIQIQALLVDSNFANPKHVAEGFSKLKLEMLIAIVNKRIKGINLRNKDIYVKIIGGLNIKDSCIDLPIIASLVSGYMQKGFGKLAFAGEVGLLGDIKTCGNLQSYKKEAKKLGFELINKTSKYKFVQDIQNLLKVR